MRSMRRRLRTPSAAAPSSFAHATRRSPSIHLSGRPPPLSARALAWQVGHPGELFTSAAPQDPLFWPLHGLAERFIQHARTLKADGALDFDEARSRDDAPHKDVAAEQRGVTVSDQSVDGRAI